MTNAKSFIINNIQLIFKNFVQCNLNILIHPSTLRRSTFWTLTSLPTWFWIFFILKIIEFTLYFSTTLLGEGPAIICAWNTRCYTIKEIWLLHAKRQSHTNISSVSGRILCKPTLPTLNFDFQPSHHLEASSLLLNFHGKGRCL